MEVVCGPTSSLYDSNALGGVVSLIIMNSADYLQEGKGRLLL